MAVPKIVERAQHRPGACFITGQIKGPFIDTGRSMRRYGHIYFSVAAIEPLLRQLGYVKEGEAGQLREQVDGLQDQLREVESELELLDQIREAVGNSVQVREREVKVEVVRDPTEEEIEAFLKERRRRAQYVPEARETPPPAEEQNEHATLPTQAPPEQFILHGQHIRLDDLLERSIPTIKDAVAGTEGSGFATALLKREVYRERLGHTPRKTLIEFLEEKE